jgi:hypothetical protein
VELAYAIVHINKTQEWSFAEHGLALCK